MDQLTKARLDDAVEILALYRACAHAGKHNHSSDWDDEYPDEASMRMQLREGRIFVLRDETGIRGALSILETDDLDQEDVDWSPGKSFVLCRICVRPQLQGHGLGARLVGLALAKMRDEGYRYVHLMTPVINTVAQAMYRKLGFRVLGVRNLYDVDFILYEKDVDR